MASGEIGRPGTLIASGLLAREADPARDAFREAGLRAESIVPVGDWTAILLRG